MRLYVYRWHHRFKNPNPQQVAGDSDFTTPYPGTLMWLPKQSYAGSGPAGEPSFGFEWPIFAEELPAGSCSSIISESSFYMLGPNQSMI